MNNLLIYVFIHLSMKTSICSSIVAITSPSLSGALLHSWIRSETGDINSSAAIFGLHLTIVPSSIIRLNTGVKRDLICLL